MPGNYFLLRYMYRLRKSLLEVRDKRMREVNQAIQAIKVRFRFPYNIRWDPDSLPCVQFIKFFAWEVKWVDRIMAARSREMAWLRKSKWTDFFVGFFWDIVPFGISIFSFMAFVLIAKGELTVAIAFPALTAFQLLTQALTKVRGCLL